MTLSEHQDAFFADVCKLRAYALECGFELITLGEAYRTVEQQQIYLRTGRSKTMQSNHLRRLAIDLNFFQQGKLIYDKPALAKLGAFWESLSPLNRWGGNFKSLVDTPHFERNV